MRKDAPSKPQLAFGVPGDLDTPTGGYAYDRRIISELRLLGWTVDVVDLGEGFPFPSLAQRASALAALSAVPSDRPTIIDGLAFGALPEAAFVRSAGSLIALVHQPLALDPGLEPIQAQAFRQTEREALAAASHVVVTSKATARIIIADYAVPASRVTVVRPGNDRVPQARSRRDGVVHLLSVGSILPVKGYDVLIAALAKLVDLPWQLTIAGDQTRNPITANQLAADISGYGLGDRIAVLGALPRDKITKLYLHTDLFVHASRFEGYGMALTEAISHGLPVVSTTAGAIPDTVPVGTGLLVEPDNVAALRSALERLITDHAERQRLAKNARAAAAEFPSWQDSTRLLASAIATFA